MGAYQGGTSISDFQSLKHIGWVGATNGPLSHYLNKKSKYRNEEMSVGGWCVNWSWKRR